MMARLSGMAIILLALSACGQGGDPTPGDVPVYDGIADSETVKLLGNEPFWGVRITGDTMVYSTPENIDGVSIAVTRFAGNGGLGFHGEWDGQPVHVAVTPGECTDGMSDRTYPFTATVRIGDLDLNGCGYSDNNPFTGDIMP